MRHGPAHHGAAGNHFARIGRQTTTVIQQLRNSRSNPNASDWPAADEQKRPSPSRRALSTVCFSVLRHTPPARYPHSGQWLPSMGRPPLGTSASGQGRYQMLLAPLRILYASGARPPPRGRNGSCRSDPMASGLLFSMPTITRSAPSTGQNPDTRQQLLAAFEHHPVVIRQVRFALHSIDNEELRASCHPERRASPE